MVVLFSLIFFLGLIALIIGLVKPSIFSFLKANPKRKDVLLRIGLPLIVLFIIIMITSPSVDYYKKGVESYNNSNYEGAYEYFGKVTHKDKNYKSAQNLRKNLIIKIDSIKNIIDKVEVKKNMTAEVSIPDKNTNTSEESVHGISILGITPIDVYGNFENKGFKVDKQISSDGSLFICSSEEGGISYEAKTFCASGVSDVTSIRLTAVRITPQYNSLEDLKPFLIYGCSIPYDASDINKIKDFIKSNFNKDKSFIIVSKVKFTIYAPTEFLRIVEIEAI